MLADSTRNRAQTGALSRDVHLQAASMYELLDFVAQELPRWRDRPERGRKTSETALTSQLCGHLASAARRSLAWDFLQFRVEEPDEQRSGRKIDLIAAPCAATVWIDGRCCYDLQTLLPIECKRLPTPRGKNREEREYVISGTTTTGGIQRFKAGHHGGAHSLAGMIGYLQQNSNTFWYDRVTTWIKGLYGPSSTWSEKDLLHSLSSDKKAGLFTYRSSHKRGKGRSDIELRHLWIEMRASQ